MITPQNISLEETSCLKQSKAQKKGPRCFCQGSRADTEALPTDSNSNTSCSQGMMETCSNRSLGVVSDLIHISYDLLVRVDRIVKVQLGRGLQLRA